MSKAKTPKSVPVKNTACKHRWRRISFSSGRAPEVSFRCSKCEATKTEIATGVIAKRIRDHFKKMWKDTERIHKVWHALLGVLMKKSKTEGMVWRKRGYDLQMLAERFVEKHPKDIDMVSVDDDMHMSSDLILVRHCAPNDWMGVTMLFIPQSGKDPAEIFLYPHSVDRLVEVLQKIQKQTKIIKRKEAAERRRTDPFRKSAR